VKAADLEQQLYTIYYVRPMAHGHLLTRYLYFILCIPH